MNRRDFLSKCTRLLAGAAVASEVSAGVPDLGELESADVLEESIIDATWDTSATDIPGNLAELSKRMQELTGYAPKTLYMTRLQADRLDDLFKKEGSDLREEARQAGAVLQISDGDDDLIGLGYD